MHPAEKLGSSVFFVASCLNETGMSDDSNMLPIRVLHIHSGNLYGGVETYLLTLARCQQLCPEMYPEFALCFEGRLSQELRDHSAIVHPLGEVRVRYPWTVLRARQTLQHLLRRHRYDVILCHSAWSQAIFGPISRKTANVNVFLLHGIASGRHWLERRAKHARPDYAICNSRYTQNSLANLYPELRSQTVYLPVIPGDKFSLAERSAIRSELRTPAESTVIIQVSRIERGKGHMEHLEALAELRENADWVAWIVGGAQRSHEREYVELLKEKARYLQIIDRLRFVGQRRDVARLLAAADIFCQPNVEGESFGISFVEALYSGLPVVTTNLGGAPEIVNDACGILIPPGDTFALRDALSRLILSRSLRTAMGKTAPIRAAEISDPCTQLTKLYQVLRHAVSGPTAPLRTKPIEPSASHEGQITQV
jgi:glycosyltransferase involved in cell wall biosynthesis